MKVLLVDDEPMSRRMLHRILIKQFGCEVIEAANGAEALDELGKAGVRASSCSTW